MATRHHVENLIRRGNIFYWRARVPQRFSAARVKDRLSLSLHVSDHRVALLLARRLNLRLAELKNSRTIDMSQDAFHRFFVNERDRQLEKLEKVALASRRYGRGDFKADVDIDLQHGWAYRLLEHFGQGAEFDFGPDCRARRWLLEQGIPPEHVDPIAEDFQAVRSLSHRGIMEQHLRVAMDQCGIANTTLNRERAMMAYFRAQADALMAVQQRYPLAAPELSQPSNPPARIEDAAGGAANTSAATALVHSPDEPPTPQSSSSDSVATPTSPDVSTLSAMATQDHVPLPLSEFFKIGEELVTQKGDDWTAESANDFRALLRIFVGVLEEHGVTHSGEIRQFHIGKLSGHFAEIPTHWGKSSRLRELSTVELRAEGQRRIESAAAANPGLSDRKRLAKHAKVGLSANTVRKHFANLQSFLVFLRGLGYVILDWTFDGVRPKKPKPGSVRLQQFKPKPKDLAPLFNAPLFTGCKGPTEREQPGSDVFHGALFYLPIMITYIGARRIELAGLHVDDIYQDEDSDNEWVIHIRPNELRRMKTVQSDRKIPLHPELLRLGILEYREQIRDLGYKALFPELFSDKTENDPGDRFYVEFVPLMKAAMGDALWDRAIHAFRHGLADYLKQNGVPPAWIDDLCGRLSEGETNTRYTNPAGLPLLRDVMAKFPIITADIPQRPVRLLPWVMDKNPSPWAREGRK